MDLFNLLNKLHRKVLSRISSLHPQTRSELWAVMACVLVSFGTWGAIGQVTTESPGHNGVLNPPTSIAVNAVGHPDGIHAYTSVSIPANIRV